MSKEEILEHIREASLYLKELNISDEKYQELIDKQAKLSLLIQALMK